MFSAASLLPTGAVSCVYVSSTQMVLDNWVVAVVCLFEYFLVSSSKLSHLVARQALYYWSKSTILYPTFFSGKLFTYWTVFQVLFLVLWFRGMDGRLATKPPKQRTIPPPQLILARNNELLGGKLITKQPALLFIADCVTYPSPGQSAGFL